jgi:hypothetical protein
MPDFRTNGNRGKRRKVFEYNGLHAAAIRWHAACLKGSSNICGLPELR